MTVLRNVHCKHGTGTFEFVDQATYRRDLGVVRHSACGKKFTWARHNCCRTSDLEELLQHDPALDDETRQWVVGVYGYDIISPYVNFAFDYTDGCLATATIPEPVLAPVIACLLRGLRVCHEKHNIIVEIHPDMVLYTMDGSIKISDALRLHRYIQYDRMREPWYATLTPLK